MPSHRTCPHLFAHLFLSHTVIPSNIILDDLYDTSTLAPSDPPTPASVLMRTSVLATLSTIYVPMVVPVVVKTVNQSPLRIVNFFGSFAVNVDLRVFTFLFADAVPLFISPLFTSDMAHRFCIFASSIHPSGQRPATGGQGASESFRGIIIPTAAKIINRNDIATTNTII